MADITLSGAASTTAGSRRERTAAPTLRRCEHAAGSHEGAVPVAASAPTGWRAWLLIEHPGPWPERIADAALPAPLRAAVESAGRHGIRVQLIRRPERRGVSSAAAPARAPFHVYTCWAGERPWLERRELREAADLSGLDLAGLARGRPTGFGEPVRDPLLLVCTHGRSNVCCAQLGRPLAAALERRYGAAAWETTHVSGDRYAANLVVLPHGLYYGPVDAPSACEAVEAYADGRVRLHRYRGRAGRSEAAQAAEHFARERTGLDGVDDVLVESETPHGRGADAPVTVTVRAADQRLVVTVEPSDCRRPCLGGGAELIRTHRVVPSAPRG